MIIAHRRNTIPLLLETPTQWGVEIDIRSTGASLMVHHDPFEWGTPLDEWLPHYQHGTLILNVKEEGLETALIQRMAHYGIVDYFFLDQSFPFLIKTARLGERRCAVRVSEYESLQTALHLSGDIDWVWVDQFNGTWFTSQDLACLRTAGFKLCAVSPELQGRPHDLDAFITASTQGQWQWDAICTKHPLKWHESVGI